MPPGVPGEAGGGCAPGCVLPVSECGDWWCWFGFTVEFCFCFGEGHCVLPPVAGSVHVVAVGAV